MIPLLIGAAVGAAGAYVLSGDSKHKSHGNWSEKVTTREISVDELPSDIREKIQRHETELDGAINFCPHCGAKVQTANAKFCMSCGKSLIND